MGYTSKHATIKPRDIVENISVSKRNKAQAIQATNNALEYIIQQHSETTGLFSSPFTTAIILVVTKKWFVISFYFFIIPQCSSILFHCERTKTTAMINTSSSHRSLWVLTLKPNYVNLSVGIVNLFPAIHCNKNSCLP